MIERAIVLFLVLTFVNAGLDRRNSDDLRDKRVMFKTYWNIPSFQCERYKLDFPGLAQKYNIIQNQNDEFRGDQMAILYDPGLFPAILNDRQLRNGGVPQEGNLTLHLSTFEEKLNELIPDRNFSGVGVIDMESWRPIYRQNFGTLIPYKDLSVEIERQKHPLWSNSQLQAEAERRFEASARAFMEDTLNLAKARRPYATWGYYIFPLCFNYKQQSCPPEVPPENDRLSWLFSASNNLNPSLYLRAENSAAQRMDSIQGRIAEAHRILGNLSGGPRSLLPYFILKYPDNDQFLEINDITNSIDLLKSLQIDGWIIWGSSNHVNTEAKCKALYNYIDTQFGPALSR